MGKEGSPIITEVGKNDLKIIKSSLRPILTVPIKPFTPGLALSLCTDHL